MHREEMVCVNNYSVGFKRYCEVDGSICILDGLISILCTFSCIYLTVFCSIIIKIGENVQNKHTKYRVFQKKLAQVNGYCWTTNSPILILFSEFGSILLPFYIFYENLSTFIMYHLW